MSSSTHEIPTVEEEERPPTSADQDPSPASSASADQFSSLSKSPSSASQTTTSPLSAPSPTHNNNNAMDDIFGSPPPSPPPTSHSPSHPHAQPERQTRSFADSNANAHGESSNFPHLRRTNYTLGYRAGISDGKNAPETAQRGFDEGFPMGAEVGVRAGWVLGMLEELVRQSGSGAGGGGEDVLAKAEAAVGMEGIMGEMERLGLLTPAADGDGEAGWRLKEDWLGDIGVLQQWIEKVEAVAKSKHVDMKVDWGG